MLGFKEKLPWSIRQKIALGTAKGIMYLHEGCQRRIIHRDITAANILLTEDFESKVWICLWILLYKYDMHLFVSTWDSFCGFSMLLLSMLLVA